MDIKVLGPGCKNCNALELATEEALAQLGMEIGYTKVSDYGEIASYGVLNTPAMMIDDDLKFAGRVPSVDELCELFRATA